MQGVEKVLESFHEGFGAMTHMLRSLHYQKLSWYLVLII